MEDRGRGSGREGKADKSVWGWVEWGKQMRGRKGRIRRREEQWEGREEEGNREK